MNRKLLLIILLLSSWNAYSKQEITAMDYVADIAFYRPTGLFNTVVSSGVFLVTLPMSIITSVFPPHDNLLESADDFIVEQFQYTFTRPLGENKSPH